MFIGQTSYAPNAAEPKAVIIIRSTASYLLLEY
jgi:hypothetical protein